MIRLIIHVHKIQPALRALDAPFVFCASSVTQPRHVPDQDPPTYRRVLPPDDIAATSGRVMRVLAQAQQLWPEKGGKKPSQK